MQYILYILYSGARRFKVSSPKYNILLYLYILCAPCDAGAQAQYSAYPRETYCYIVSAVLCFILLLLLLLLHASRVFFSI